MDAPGNLKNKKKIQKSSPQKTKTNKNLKRKVDFMQSTVQNSKGKSVEKPKIKSRKNKNYTSILLQEITEQAFIEARKERDALAEQGEPVVIRINKAVYKKFFQLHSLEFKDTTTGDEIDFLGTKYLIASDMDEQGLTKVEYYTRNVLDNGCYSNPNYEWVKEESYCWGNVAHAFLETSFKNKTGTLLYF